MSSTLLSLNCVSTKWTFVSKMWSFFFRRREEEKKGEKKKDCSFAKSFCVEKDCMLFLRILLLRDRLHKKYKIVSLSHREHTKHEYTFLLYSFAPHLLLKRFRFAAAIE